VQVKEISCQTHIMNGRISSAAKTLRERSEAVSPSCRGERAKAARPKGEERSGEPEFTRRTSETPRPKGEE